MFKIASLGLIAIPIVWACLIVGELFVVLDGFRAIIHGRISGVLLSVFYTGVLYALFEAGTWSAAKLMTNNVRGYRPWQWGMVARTDLGRSAQEFDISLSYHEVKNNFEQGH